MPCNTLSHCLMKSRILFIMSFLTGCNYFIALFFFTLCGNSSNKAMFNTKYYVYVLSVKYNGLVEVWFSLQSLSDHVPSDQRF